MNNTFTQHESILGIESSMDDNFIEYQELIKRINDTLICPDDKSVSKILDYSISTRKIENTNSNLN